MREREDEFNDDATVATVLFIAFFVSVAFECKNTKTKNERLASPLCGEAL